MVWFNQNYASRALEKLCPALHLHLLLEPPPDFVKVLSRIFNLSLLQTLRCWLSNVEKQTRHSHNRRSDSSREESPKQCGIYAWNKNFRRAIAVSNFGLLPNFSQNRNHEFEKNWHWNAKNFKEPRSFGLKDTFCRLKRLCLTIYLVWSNEMISDWKQETVFQSQ